MKPIYIPLFTVALVSALLSTPAVAAAQSHQAQAGDGASDEATISAVDGAQQRELAELARQLRQETDQLLDGIDSAYPTNVEDALRQVSAPRGPIQIFDWIQHQIDFEPYTGSLRGARGTLVSRSGNAADQALLGQAMLDAAGYETQFVTGTLHRSDAARLLDSTLGSVKLLNRTDARRQPFSDGPLLNLSSILASVGNHVWLEIATDDHRRPFDPVAASTYGMTPATAQNRHDRLPDKHHTEFEMTLISHLDDNRSLEHLIVDAQIATLAFESITLSFEHDPRRDRGHIPIVSQGEHQLRGDSIPVSSVDRLELRFRFQNADREDRWRQVLYRRGQGLDAFEFDHQHFGIAVAPGWTSENRLRYMAGTAAADAIDLLGTWLDAEARAEQPLDDKQQRHHINAILDRLGAALPFAFARTLDRATEEVAAQLGVMPILGRPRILTTGLLRQDDKFHLDLQVDGDRLQALPKSGIPNLATTSFLGVHGLIRDRLVGEMLEAYGDHRVTTVGGIFEQATAQSIPFTTFDSQNISRLDQISIGDSTREAMQNQIRQQNMTLLAPIRAVEEDDIERFGWWAVDAYHGSLEAHTSDAILALAERDNSQSMGPAKLIHAHLILIARHFSAAYHATSQEDRFPELACTASQQFQRLGRAFCAVSEPLDRPELSACFDSPPAPEADLLRLHEADCVSQLAPFRCASALSAAILDGQLVVADDEGDVTPQSLPRALCD